MNAIRIIKGDLLDLTEVGQFDAIAQGCNCHNMMGAGIARLIANKWPEVQEVDSLTTKGCSEKLGGFSHQSVKTMKRSTVVYNLYTQYNGGTDAKYEHLKSSFTKMLFHITACKLKISNFETTQINIGLPLIGAGIGGLDKDKVIELITNCLSRFCNPMVEIYVTIVEFEDHRFEKEMTNAIVSSSNYENHLLKLTKNFEKIQLSKFTHLQVSLDGIYRRYEKFKVWPHTIAFDEEYTSGQLNELLIKLVQYVKVQRLPLPIITLINQEELAVVNVKILLSESDRYLYNKVKNKK